VVRVIDTADLPAHPWIGKLESSVLDDWGRPPTREPDGRGGVVLSYRGKSRVESSEAVHPHSDPKNPTRTETPPSPFGRETVVREAGVVARFWVNDEGMVYRVWFAPAVYESGEDNPGARSESDLRRGSA
jgi:hypothetical protein